MISGPVLTPLEKDVGAWLGLDELIGPYLFAGALFLAGAVVFSITLRPDPLVLVGGTDPHAARTRPIRQVRRSYGVIRSSPGAVLGIVAMAGSQAAMVGVMTMTPPHMKDHDHGDLSALVIAVHIVVNSTTNSRSASHSESMSLNCAGNGSDSQAQQAG